MKRTTALALFTLLPICLTGSQSSAEEPAPSSGVSKFSRVPNFFAMPAKPYTPLPTTGLSRPASERSRMIERRGSSPEIRAFARAVLAALQETMPQERILGRLTVRLVLNEDGTIQSAKLLTPTPDGRINADILFAATHAAYPRPPVSATLLDRTFRASYVYDK